ncbi:MAG: hypothetical protein AAGC74_11215 [Verrucomicrobiota bacterium]
MFGREGKVDDCLSGVWFEIRRMERVVVPEILDGLSADDERAKRSRRDLRLINWLMGNERWIGKQVVGGGGVVELGAGDGRLACRLAGLGLQVTGLDLQERPEGLGSGVSWVAGDLFETLAGVEGEVVVGGLILHHFDDGALARLGRLLAEKRKLVFAEPLREVLALVEGALLWPLVNEVTRHDMMVSIRAGFRRGELRGLLGLEEGWRWEEWATLRGGLWSVAIREDK